MRIHDEVSDALAAGRPVVALESTIISHGLPRPRNLGVAREIEAAVRSAGAVPATIALVGGEVRIGLDDDALEAIAEQALARKIGARGLRMIIEELMLDLMYTLPGQKKVRECVITREVVMSKEKPITLIEKAG